jgi:hypothetical protein
MAIAIGFGDLEGVPKKIKTTSYFLHQDLPRGKVFTCLTFNLLQAACYF